MEIREHGSSGPWLVAIHGGPGAPGTVAPVARALAGSFRVLEPWQRRSDGEPLTVARHLEDLDRSIRERCRGVRPALVGHSWGAMLALAYAAAHPGTAGPLVLVGCGTFDPVARRRFEARLERRMDRALRRRLDRLSAEVVDADERLSRAGELLLPAYSFGLVSAALEAGPCDAQGHRETWQDMLRLQAEGVYPAAFAAIESPVLMLHGEADPHPGGLIRESLARWLRRVEYHELPRCGHYPWLERSARKEFFEVLSSWLARACEESSRTA